ncbi:DDE-type integrase/transposase/recombinase [Rhodococcus sp. DMU2021]|nr:DDE-type integrase/transposase/recombinase [Rhodococcus sp. DMU2021]
MIKDVCSNQIVGYSIGDRMKSRLVVAALESAVARRGSVAGYVVHPDGGSQFRSRHSFAFWGCHGLVRTMCPGRGEPATTPRWNRSLRCSSATSSTGSVGSLASSCASRSSLGHHPLAVRGSRGLITVGNVSSYWAD